MVVNVLDLRCEGQWLEAWSLPSRCFLRQETFLHIVTVRQGLKMCNSGLLHAGGNPAMDWHPIRGGGGGRREVSKTHLIQAIETHNSGRVGILRIVCYFLTFSSFASRQGTTE